ncbi:hypothetical protein A2872_03885 [Candidatus Gottesmanbacteria bacterium RIFCSPHIGHO2_01_FULL_42_12]|uniref:HTH cro/C1-type domain-containing protein n=1 Tax=Candidatus Gottesmanbacteria bacterium RIFCSPHIGHO2_01_FULL_42_12 TaxID=1798377 RepID=A0A1F5Z4F8_9BACT|nr:MAG: hypothetical protein A2872_03885 [Candidatus Gottesmanbacteria bacterium RIFCSPHIGHO2_01_FULL_42_12]
MTTVGDILKDKRLEKKLSLTDVEKAIRVRAKFLEAIESNDFSFLPPPTFTRGFIKNYAIFLGLPAEQILAFYRREVNSEKDKILPVPPQKIRQKFALTPQLVTYVGVGIMLFLFFAYLSWQYFQYSGSPRLRVDSPQDYLIMKTSPVEVRGETDPEAVLKVNDEIVSVGDSGQFELKIDLNAGLNTFTFVASNKFKKESRVVRHVRLETPQ